MQRALRKLITSIGAEAVIACNSTRKKAIAYDFEVYSGRNTVERCFNKLKHVRHVATRFDTNAANFLGFL